MSASPSKGSGGPESEAPKGTGSKQASNSLKPKPKGKAKAPGDLDPQERLWIEAATGYWELGMEEETLHELDGLAAIAPQTASLPIVQKLRLMALLDLGQWADGLETARRLCREGDPEFFDAHLKAAFCLHEMNRTREARETLLNAPNALRKLPLYHYNLACYECRLGRLGEARQHLNLALSMDEGLLPSSRLDSDLAPLWESPSSGLHQDFTA